MITRYLCGNAKEMFQDEEGDWVLYTDYLALVEKYKALKGCNKCHTDNRF